MLDAKGNAIVTAFMTLSSFVTSAEAYDVYCQIPLPDGYVLQIAGGKGDCVDILMPSGKAFGDHFCNGRKINAGDIDFVHLGKNRINLVVRNGRNRDLCRCYAIIGDRVVPSHPPHERGYHIPGKNHSVKFITDNIVQHSGGGQVNQYRFIEGKWTR